ncbi:MAG: PQQ-binding-like beta-propeller repeat protein [Verrucomicrobiae bacterium]|nr:PQQ-binding-like beta-propeller repeat protein [Verrucomicrobiae bacterium]
MADGKVFALGSTQTHCVDALTGRLLWSAPLPGKAPGSSPLVAGGRVFVNSGQLVAYDAATGKELWRQDKAGGSNASPAHWRDASGVELVICNSRNALVAVKPDTGAIVWSTPGGGDSTPAFSGNHLAVQMKTAAIGFAAYEISATAATRKWNHASDPRRTQSSPIIHEGRVYHMEDGEQFCWELAGGKLLWKESVPGEISSPILADGKLFVPINKGNNIQILRAGGEREELGRALVRATWCPSPAIADGRLLLRMKDGIHASHRRPDAAAVRQAEKG